MEVIILMVSIIIPVYNTKEEYLNKCIDSVLKQTYRNIEIIIIDDGSNNTTYEICELIKLKDERVFVYHKENGGVSSARNAGLNVAKGSYISFIDADDWVEPYFIECLLTSMIRTKADLSSVCFNHEFMQDCKTSSTIQEEYQTFVYEKENVWGQILYSTKIGGFLWNKLFKKEFIIQMLDEKLHYCEDFVFTAEYCKNVKKMVFIDLPLYHYRQENGNVTSDFSYNLKILTLIEAYKRLEEILESIDND